MEVAALNICPNCSAPGQTSLFCNSCSVYMVEPASGVQKVTFNRRFWGTYLLESLLYLVTLIIGWYIWLAFTAKTSQSPAKRLLDVYVLDIQSVQPITAGRVWVREVLVKQLLVGLVGAVTSYSSSVRMPSSCNLASSRSSSAALLTVPLGLPPDIS